MLKLCPEDLSIADDTFLCSYPPSMSKEKSGVQGISRKGNHAGYPEALDASANQSRLAGEHSKGGYHDVPARASLRCGLFQRPGRNEKPLYLSHLTTVEEVTEDDGIDSPIHEHDTDGESHGIRLVAADIGAGLSVYASCEEVWRSADEGLMLKQNAGEHAHHPVSHKPNSSFSVMEPPLSVSVTRTARDNKLLAFRRNSRNIVLDSLCPDVAPHIVITPPDDRWEDYYIPSENAVNPQSPYYLSIPPLPHRFLAATRNPRSLDGYCGGTSLAQPGTSNAPSSTRSPNNSPPSSQLPQAVFSPSLFMQSVERSSEERLVMFYVCSAVQRLHCRNNAFAAARKALAFRSRYDLPESIQLLEKPFQWSDPAEPLLLASKYLKWTTIIESDWPCSVPHIIINEPPPQDPWIAWHNATNDPQDPGSGMYLTVPSRWGSRTKPLEEEDDSCDSLSIYSTSDGDLLDIPTRPDTPEPGTPNDDNPRHFLPQFLCIMEVVAESSEDASVACVNAAEAFPIIDRTDAVETGSTYPSYASYDEDEGLPPLDGWCKAYLHMTTRV